MKKLVLILAALVAVVAFAMPLFADDQFEVSGEFSFGMLTKFDSELDGGGFADAYIDLFFYPDEYNEVFLELGWAKEWDYSKSQDDDIAATYFALRTDVGAFLGLPIGVVNHAGVDSLYTNKYEVSGHAYERTLIRSDIDPVPWIVALDGGSWQAKAAIGWGQTDPTAIPPEEAGSNNDIGFYLFIPALGPAEVEAWYLAENNPDWKGRLGFSAKADGLAGGLFGVAGGFVYDLNDGSSRTAGDKLWAYGVGVGLDYMGGALGVSLNGDDTDVLYQLGVDLDYAFGDFGVIAAAGFNFGDGMESFQGLDVGAYLKAGGAKWQVGYLYRDQTGYSYTWAPADIYAGAPAAAPEGGLYFFADIDF
jgi:hypothetical protein